MNGKIPPRERSTVSEAMTTVDEFKKKTVRAVLNNSGSLITIFIILVVGVVMTTEIRFDSAADFASLGLDFFVLLLCSYGMYVNLAASGTKQGLLSPDYINMQSRYDTLNEKINNGQRDKLIAFCEDYVAKELKSTRTIILANVGISYETYAEKYIGKDKIDEELTKLQRAAIKKANGVKPIKLTPDMIVTKTMGKPRRSPLGLAPSTKKVLVFSGKFSTTALTSLLTIWIALDVIMNPDWNVLVMALLRILTVVLNGFSGWQFGYDNVVVDRVNYLSDKCDLMEQALRFEIK